MAPKIFRNIYKIVKNKKIILIKIVNTDNTESIRYLVNNIKQNLHKAFFLKILIVSLKIFIVLVKETHQNFLM
jgi:hypothetical protein